MIQEMDMQRTEDKADILTRPQAAAFIGVCQNTFDKLDIPRTKVLRRVFYKREVILRWLDQHTEKVKGASAYQGKKI